MRLLVGDDEGVSRWVQGNIPHCPTDFGPCVAIGVVDTSGNPMAGVVYHDYQKEFGTIQLSVAAVTPRWATKNVIRGLLMYPFHQLGCHLIWASTPHKNERVIRFNKGIGFTQEAVLRDRYGPGVHAVIFRMMRTAFDNKYMKLKEAA